MNSKIVALLTDFGYKDAYVGVMKAVIASRDPEIRIIDLSHGIEAHNLLSAAYILYSAWEHFPRGSVFCVVVDPGVGSDRGTLLAEFSGRWLIAPDNGLISLLVRMIPDGRVNALRTDSIEVGKEAPSNTFHGRDLFAPAAVRCAQGAVGQIRGGRIEPVLLPSVNPQLVHNSAAGVILHVDRFGNCISSIHRSDLQTLETGCGGSTTLTVQADTFRSIGLHRSYAEVSVGTVLCLIGSSGFLEIAVREGSAAERFKLHTGQSLKVTIGES